MFSQSATHSRLVTPRRRRTDDIGEAIRARRDELGWTQSQLAAAIGVEDLSVRNWEVGRHRPRDRHLKRLGEVLGLELLTSDLRALVTVAGSRITVTASMVTCDPGGDAAMKELAAAFQELAAERGWLYERDDLENRPLADR